MCYYNMYRKDLGGLSMKFSIIVPVYQVEDYLVRCVDSILTQTFEDYELILVDDGSLDKSPQICDQYALQDGRIKVLHKSNGGLSSARNAGLDVASGDYVIFVDSDDWLEQGCLLTFNKILNEHPVDVLMTVKTSVYSDKSFLEVDNFEEYLQNGFDKERATDWILYYAKSVGAPNKIIKREIIEKNNLRFLERQQFLVQLQRHITAFPQRLLKR